MIVKPNILVVCGRNKKRSRTAEYIFRNDQRLNIISAGLSPKSNRKISAKDVEWADHIIVMEYDHKERIQSEFKSKPLPKIEVLSIPDEYEYLDPELIKILESNINEILIKEFGS